MSRVVAAAVSLVLLGATAAPVLRAPHDDGFPLSTYPMFATPRPTQLTLDYARGVTATGAPCTLAPALIGTGEVLQAVAVISRARAARQLPALCVDIAARVAADHAFADVVAVQIVTGTHDAVAFLVHGVRGREIERARCEVRR